MESQTEKVLLNSMSSTSALMVLGEYLSHISFIKEKIPIEVREEARIGADVIAASSQYLHAAVDSLSSEDSSPLPLPVFGLTRSSIYGLLYLDNVDLVRKKERLPSTGRFIQRTMDRWNNGSRYGFSKFDTDRDYHELWTQLSHFVHIIPAIKKEGGAKFNEVNFEFLRDLSKPTRHAGLPDQFDVLASECLEWQSMLTLATILRFREKHNHLFEFSSTKLQDHINGRVFPDCVDSIRSIPGPDATTEGLSRLAKSIFSA